MKKPIIIALFFFIQTAIIFYGQDRWVEENIYCKLPNLAYFKLVLSVYGFKYLKDYHEYSIRMLQNRYNEENRFLAVFER